MENLKKEIKDYKKIVMSELLKDDCKNPEFWRGVLNGINESEKIINK